MKVDFTPDVDARLNQAAEASGRSAVELVQDAVAAYLDELAEIRRTLDCRYDDVKSGRVRPMDGEAFFEELRRLEEERIRRSA